MTSVPSRCRKTIRSNCHYRLQSLLETYVVEIGMHRVAITGVESCFARLAMHVQDLTSFEFQFSLQIVPFSRRTRLYAYTSLRCYSSTILGSKFGIYHQYTYPAWSGINVHIDATCDSQTPLMEALQGFIFLRDTVEWAAWIPACDAGNQFLQPGGREL